MNAKIPRWLQWLLASGTTTAALLLAWSAGIEPRLVVVERESATVPDLPEAWEGRRIGLIADLQIGMWFANTDTVRRVVTRLVNLRPAAVLIAGDLMYHPLDEASAERRSDLERGEIRDKAEKEIHKIMELLRPLSTAGIPTYAVLGNHDYALRSSQVSALPTLAQQLQEGLARVGVRVLRNEAILLPTPAGAAANGAAILWLVGLGPHLPGHDYTKAAFAQLPENAPRLVLMHNPASFRELPPGRAPLAMAGHTHGGQIRFPWLALRRLLGRVHGKAPVLSGWIHDQRAGGNRLYINRGIGFSRLPLRLNSPPELTLFTLRATARN